MTIICTICYIVSQDNDININSNENWIDNDHNDKNHDYDGDDNDYLIEAEWRIYASEI